MPTATRYAAIAADIDAVIRLAGGRVPVVARLGAGRHTIGAACSLREARRLVRQRGFRLVGDDRPQVEEGPAGDALVVRCRWR